MGGIKDRQANQDLWHLSIEDLLTPPTETPRLGGDGPFIINLSTSTAPIAIPPKDQLNIEGIHAYQISRTEDGRQRFRLRLGPISTELEADAMLSAIRDRYPGAMIATAADDDLRAIASAGRVAKSAKAGKPVARTTAKPAAKPAERKASPLPLPSQPAVTAHDDANEITGSGWDLDSLLPHLSGPEPAPKSTPAAAKAAPVAKKVAPAPPKAKPPVVAKSPAQSPVTTPPPATVRAPTPTPPTAKAPAKSPAAQPPAQKTVAAPATPVAATIAPPAPPVLTAALEPKSTVEKAPTPATLTSPTPVADTQAVPILEIAAPQIAAEIVPPLPAAVVEPAPPAPIAEAAPPVVHVPPTAPVEAIAPPIVEIAAAPIADAVPPPAVEVAATSVAEVVPPPAAEVAPPPVVEMTASPAAEVAAPPTAVIPQLEPVVAPEPPKAVVSKPLPPLTVTRPRPQIPASTRATVTPPPVAAAPPPVAKTVAPPTLAPVEMPPADPLETDWASILSAPVEDTASRPAFASVVQPSTPPAPFPTAAANAPEPVVETKTKDDSGLQRLVDKSNALIDELEIRTEFPAPTPPPVAAAEPATAVVPAVTQPTPAPEIAATVAPAFSQPMPEPEVVAIALPAAAQPMPVAEFPRPPAPVFEPVAPLSAADLFDAARVVEVPPAAMPPPTVFSADPPGVIFSPLNTQSIEQKLAKLAEILHGGEQAESQAPASIAPVAPAALVVEDTEMFFDDDEPQHVSTMTGSWPSIERRQEPRPELKSAAAVLTSIDELVVVDEANNLDDLVAKEAAVDKEPVIDSTAETDRVPVLKEPAAKAQPELPPVAATKPEPLTVEAPQADAPIPVLALVLESDLTLEPELTLAPSAAEPPPVLVEDWIISGEETNHSLRIFVEKNNAFVDALEIAPPAAPPVATPTPPKIEAPVELKLAEAAQPEPVPQAPLPPVSVSSADDDIVVVSTIVLEKPAPKPAGEEPHIRTIVLEPTPAAASTTPAEATKPTETAKSAPVVIRTRESAADADAKNATHQSARAAARAAKKMRLAKHAAKQAAAAASKGNGAAAAKPHPEPATPPKPQQPVATAAPVPAPPVAPAIAPTPPPKTEAPAPKAAVPAAKPAPIVARKSKDKPQPTAPKVQPAPAKPVQPTAAKPVAPPTPAIQKPTHAPAHAASAHGSNGATAPERKVTIRTEHTPSMDSTQTMRALTPLELADDQISKWFVIQLAVSEDDFDPDQIPHLDIFEAYRLYAVIGLDQGKILHALRLGFFSDEISASAVTSYLQTHFEGAAVKRVSVAERERFAESQVSARKDIGATGMHAIIEMASPKPVKETRLADLAAASGQRKPEEKSLWSKLVSPLKRQ